MSAAARRGRARRWLVLAPGLLVAGFLVLAIPLPEAPSPAPAGGAPFAWRQDARWHELEARFVAARAAGCLTQTQAIEAGLSTLMALTDALAPGTAGADDPRLDAAERVLFETAPLVAACPAHLPELARLQARLRDAVKRQSRGWDMSSRAVRDRLYRVLYGGRTAVEEAILQAPPGALLPFLPGEVVTSRTPGTEVRGVMVHSGDLLLSRGTAPTSALIARGNDYPGNFSHVAMLVVEREGDPPRLLEAHIERGVAIASGREYLGDAKFRILLLRPRADLPALARDPLLPHRAAMRVVAETRTRHIPYDFAMDFTDPGRLFCSEVASWAYREEGVTLWMGLSHISSPGLARWLAGFGVTHFETQEPSDLEADPQLAVVAEWRDLEGLWQDHVDNAVVEAMLAGAEEGQPLDYPWYLLPAGRVAKAWSAVCDAFGRVGPVPQGMTAPGALRNRTFSLRHAAIKERTRTLAAQFEAQHGYRPPYWQLVRLARTASTTP
ncbi:MAG: hypothetical protein MUF10_17410 [Thermoanaerobaculaceae bacterium]|nr:hypothetical protein [Thermoanaerobaculaceae bacterium]